MLHSKLDTGNKLSTQTPSSTQWMGTRGHLKRVFTCVVSYISGASSHNCSYNDFKIYLHLVNWQNYFMLFEARTGFTLVSMILKLGLVKILKFLFYGEADVWLRS